MPDITLHKKAKPGTIKPDKNMINRILTGHKTGCTHAYLLLPVTLSQLGVTGDYITVEYFTPILGKYLATWVKNIYLCHVSCMSQLGGVTFL